MDNLLNDKIAIMQLYRRKEFDKLDSKISSITFVLLCEKLNNIDSLKIIYIDFSIYKGYCNIIFS